MRKTQSFIALGMLVALPTLAMAQGTVRGAEDGADAGARAAGPVGGVVGGAVGAATGTVGGVVGIPAERGRGCTTRTEKHEDAAGSDTVKRTDCD